MFETIRRMGLILTLLACFSATAFAQSGQADFERGETLLKLGDFQQALEAYKSAAKAAPDNQAYAKRAAVVRQILMIEKIAANEADARWPQAVHSLHRFYLSNGLAKRALPLDRKLHAREGTKATGYDLAMTLSEMNEIAEASEILGGVLAKGEDVGVRVMRAIFLARLGKAEQARANLAKTPESLTDSSALYNRACALSLLGDKAKAASELARSFDHTPADQLATSKEWAKKDSDLAAIHGTPEFAKALGVAGGAAGHDHAGCKDGAKKEGGCDMEKKGGCDMDKKGATKDGKKAACGSKPECGGCDKMKKAKNPKQPWF